MRLRQTLMFMVLFIITFVLMQTEIVLDQNLYRATRITIVIIEFIVIVIGIRRIFKMA